MKLNIVRHQVQSWDQLFNINGIDLFFEFENNHIASSADDTKPLLIQATLILQSLKNCLPPRHLSLV